MNKGIKVVDIVNKKQDTGLPAEVNNLLTDIYLISHLFPGKINNLRIVPFKPRDGYHPINIVWEMGETGSTDISHIAYDGKNFFDWTTKVIGDKERMFERKSLREHLYEEFARTPYA